MRANTRRGEPWGVSVRGWHRELTGARLGSGGLGGGLKEVGLCSGLDIIRSRGDSMIGYLDYFHVKG